MAYLSRPTSVEYRVLHVTGMPDYVGRTFKDRLDQARAKEAPHQTAGQWEADGPPTITAFPDGSVAMSVLMTRGWFGDVKPADVLLGDEEEAL